MSTQKESIVKIFSSQSQLNLGSQTFIEFHEEEKFKKIIQIAGISNMHIQKSFDLFKNKNQVFKAGNRSGLSGQFFFFS